MKVSNGPGRVVINLLMSLWPQNYCFLTMMISYLALLKHILITGGSSGIGLSIAELCVTEYLPHLQQLTILARGTRQLETAQKHLEQLIETMHRQNNNKGVGASKPKVHIK